MRTKRTIWTLLSVLLLFSLACVLLDTSTATPEPNETAADVTEGTEEATQEPTEEPTDEVTEEPTPEETEAPVVTGEAGCTLKAAFVADVTIPDDTEMVPDEAFDKPWRIRNSGTCEWEDGTEFVFVSGDPLNGPPSVSVDPAGPNDVIDVTAPLQAPSSPGTYRSNWQLQTPDGTRFGPVFFTRIAVEAEEEATAEPTAEPTDEPTSEVTGPDLKVEAVIFDPDPVAQMPIKVTVQVRNQGNENAGAFRLKWWGGKNFTTPSCSWDVGTGLNAETALNLDCEFTYKSYYGSIESKATVDTEDGVDESDEDNNTWLESISVSRPEVVYDFVEKADTVSWQAGPPTVNLPFPGSPGDSDGFVIPVSGENWETGSPVQGTCLETHPRWVNDGVIAGTYIDIYQSGYVVEEGDRFRATVGLLEGAGAGDVNFLVMIRSSGTVGNVWIADVNDTYGDGLKTIDVDLTPYAGSPADFILKVEANGDSAQDWACWSNAVIYRYP